MAGMYKVFLNSKKKMFNIFYNLCILTKFISRQMTPEFVAKDPQASPVWEICNYFFLFIKQDT